MIKRTLYFGNPSYLSIQNEQLHIRFPEVEQNATNEEVKKRAFTTIPVEDIGVVVLDHAQITISHFTLHKLLSNNVALITCNEQHMPCGLMLPLEGNTIQAERFKYQIEASLPLKKQLWQQTVQAKIMNQAAVLQHDASKRRLIKLSQEVKSGDAGNLEAQAAASYWKHIFYPEPFFRSREGAEPNNLLNYGYAILRATMARSIVASGLLPTLGIFHRNRYNAYALADDLMEPYRPYVDKLVLQLKAQGSQNFTLTKEVKALFLGIPSMDVTVNGEKSPLMIAMQRTTASLAKCFEGKQRKLALPEMEIN